MDCCSQSRTARASDWSVYSFSMNPLRTMSHGRWLMLLINSQPPALRSINGKRDLTEKVDGWVPRLAGTTDVLPPTGLRTKQRQKRSACTTLLRDAHKGELNGQRAHVAKILLEEEHGVKPEMITSGR